MMEQNDGAYIALVVNGHAVGAKAWNECAIKYTQVKC